MIRKLDAMKSSRKEEKLTQKGSSFSTEEMNAGAS